MRFDAFARNWNHSLNRHAQEEKEVRADYET